MRTGERIGIHGKLKGRDISGLVKDMLSELDSPGDVLVTNEPYTQKIYNKWYSPFVEYYPTKKRWHANTSGIICLQLRGTSNSAPEADIDKISSLLPGHKFVELGLPMTVREDILTASKAEAFIGVDSGMSHLCHSVGIPIFIARYGTKYKAIHKWHGGRKFVLCSNVDSVINSFKESQCQIN
jgi:hypothetical protein